MCIDDGHNKQSATGGGNDVNGPQSQDARRIRSIDEIQGIPNLEFSSTSAIGTPL